MKKKYIKYLSNIIYPIISFVIIILFWVIAAAIKNNPLVLPYPNVVFSEFFSLFGKGSFYLSIGNTFWRTLLCFAISFILALSLASVSIIFKPIYKIINPIVSFLRAAPTVAVILIMYAYLGAKELTIVIGFLISFPILYSSFYTALNEIDPKLVEMCKLYNVKRIDRVSNLYIPSITSCLFDTSRTTLSLTLKVVIATEILTSVANSIGNSITVANLSFEIASLLAWTLVAILLSYILELLVFGLKKLWERLR